jgi:O-antigen ligase
MSSDPRSITTTHILADDRWDLLELLLVFSALLAPMSLRVWRAFTAYDLVTGLIACLIFASRGRMRWIPSSLRIAALLLLVAALISAFRSTYPLEAFYQVAQYGFVFFVQLPVILTLARSRTTVHWALAMLAVGHFIVVLVAMVQQDEVAGRALPFYQDENPNALAVPTVFLLPFVMYFAHQQLRARRRFVVFVVTPGALYLMLWALTASASRASTAASIVSLCVFVALGHEIKLDWRIFARVGALILALVALVAAVYWTGLFPDTLKNRIESSIGGREQHSVTDNRTALNRAGIRAFLESPLIGTGFDNFRHVAHVYDDDATFHDPHNLWIQFLAQTGLVGAGAFLFIIVRWFVLLARMRSTSPIRLDRELLAAFIAAMVGVMTHSMVAPLVLHRHYWLLYGLGIATAIDIVVSRGEPLPASLPRKEPGRERYERLWSE